MQKQLLSLEVVAGMGGKRVNFSIAWPIRWITPWYELAGIAYE
jgi:hypothetical protein